MGSATLAAGVLSTWGPPKQGLYCTILAALPTSPSRFRCWRTAGSLGVAPGPYPTLGVLRAWYIDRSLQKVKDVAVGVAC